MSTTQRILRWFDRITLATMAVGVLLVLQPWWEKGLAAGFAVTLSATLAQIIVSHLVRPEPS